MIRCRAQVFGSTTHNHLSNGGFAIMEIILILVLIGIIGANIIVLQQSSWKRTGSSNRQLIAGQMIEKQIESLRMQVDAAPTSSFPPEPGSYRENGVNLVWEFTTVNHLKGAATSQSNIRQCNLSASWGDSRGDTMRVTTYLAKNF